MPTLLSMRPRPAQPTDIPETRQIRMFPTLAQASGYPHKLYQFKIPKSASARPKGALLEPNQAEQRWSDYLRLLPQRLRSGDAIAIAIESFWNSLRELIPSVTPPNARPTDDGSLRVSWNRSGKYLEIVIAPNATYEWSYTDAPADVFDEGENISTLVPIPTELIARVRDIF